MLGRRFLSTIEKVVLCCQFFLAEMNGALIYDDAMQGGSHGGCFAKRSFFNLQSSAATAFAINDFVYASRMTDLRFKLMKAWKRL